jgi:hypothetical protein
VTGGDDWVEERIRHYTSEPWLPAGSPFAGIAIDAVKWTAALTQDEVARLLTTFHAYIRAPEDQKPGMLRKFVEHVAGDARIRADPDGLVPVPMVCHVWRAVRE